MKLYFWILVTGGESTVDVYVNIFSHGVATQSQMMPPPQVNMWPRRAGKPAILGPVNVIRDNLRVAALFTQE